MTITITETESVKENGGYVLKTKLPKLNLEPGTYTLTVSEEVETTENFEQYLEHKYKQDDVWYKYVNELKKQLDEYNIKLNDNTPIELLLDLINVPNSKFDRSIDSIREFVRSRRTPKFEVGDIIANKNNEIWRITSNNKDYKGVNSLNLHDIHKLGWEDIDEFEEEFDVVLSVDDVIKLTSDDFINSHLTHLSMISIDNLNIDRTKILRSNIIYFMIDNLVTVLKSRYDTLTTLKLIKLLN